jgi:hypothetical protein
LPSPIRSSAMSSDPRLPAIFSAQFLDRAADALHHRHEAEGADMRMRLPQDVVGRARLDELLQHLAPQEARVFHPAIELAVRKGARAALAELYVAVRVEHARGATGPRYPWSARALPCRARE